MSYRSSHSAIPCRLRRERPHLQHPAPGARGNYPRYRLERHRRGTDRTRKLYGRSRRLLRHPHRHHQPARTSFEPGSYHLHIYNTPQHITVSGITATVAGASGNVDGAGPFVQEMPGWLFTDAVDAVIEPDTEQTFTAVMQQQVRQLTLVIEPTGSTTDRIEHIEGYLSGVAGTLDFSAGIYATPTNVELQFAKITSGANAGKYAATVRLLGIAGEQQKLNAIIRFTGGSPEALNLTSDLTTELAAFNADKRKPLTLGGKVVETPTGADFSATITDWTPGNGEGGEGGSAGMETNN